MQRYVHERAKPLDSKGCNANRNWKGHFAVIVFERLSLALEGIPKSTQEHFFERAIRLERRLVRLESDLLGRQSTKRRNLPVDPKIAGENHDASKIVPARTDRLRERGLVDQLRGGLIHPRSKLNEFSESSEIGVRLRHVEESKHGRPYELALDPDRMCRFDLLIHDLRALLHGKEMKTLELLELVTGRSGPESQLREWLEIKKGGVRSRKNIAKARRKLSWYRQLGDGVRH